MNNILFIFWTTLFLYIVLETDAIPRWGNLLRLRFFQYEAYQEKCKMFGGIKYKDFLLMKYDNFFVNLITCQECLCVWLNILGFALFAKEFHGWLFFAVTTLGAMISIALFKSILKKLYG